MTKAELRKAYPKPPLGMRPGIKLAPDTNRYETTLTIDRYILDDMTSKEIGETFKRLSSYNQEYREYIRAVEKWH